MTNSDKWMRLQLFGEGGGAAAGGSAAAGNAGTVAGGADSAAADDGQQRLRELGVPEDRLRQRAKRNAKRKEKGAAAQVAAAKPSVPEQKGQRMSWDEIMADPEYNGKMQEVVRARVKDSKQPVHRAPEQIPYEAGKNHMKQLRSQANEMKQRYPNFNFDKEMENEQFFRLTSPYMGLSLEDAYMALHHREVDAERNRIVAQGLRREMSEALRSGSLRPVENGIGAKAAAVTTFDYKNASRSERAALRKQIYDAAARGEKIYPNGR